MSAEDSVEEPLAGRMTFGLRSRTPICGAGAHAGITSLWVAYEANLGTLFRTCDAVGACMAASDTEHYRRALEKGDTLTQRPHIHWLRRSKTD